MPESKGLDLSVVVPAYREEQRLGPGLARIREYLDSRGWRAEIIVVDDGSGDGTGELARELLADYPHHQVLVNDPNQGKGWSVRRGMLAASGRYALFTDTDLSTPIETFDDFKLAHDAGADIVIGSRAMAGSDIVVHQPFLREMAGRCFNLFIRTFIMGGIVDTQCGFKSFRREAIRPVFGRQQIRRWGFDVEVLYIAKRLGYEVVELPVVWRNDEATKINPVADGLRMCQEALQARRMHKHLTVGDKALAVTITEE